MTFNIELPLWAIIIIISIWVLEKVCFWSTSPYIKKLSHRICILIFYHNDEEFYKLKRAKKHARQALSREQYKKNGRYESTSLADFLKKNKNRDA